MPLINCPECGSEVSNKAPSCPKCGVIINHGDSKGIKTIGMVLAILMPILGFLVGLFMLVGQSSKPYAVRTLVTSMIFMIIWPALYLCVIAAEVSYQNSSNDAACMVNRSSINKGISSYLNINAIDPSEFRPEYLTTKEGIFDYLPAHPEGYLPSCPEGHEYYISVTGNSYDPLIKVSCPEHGDSHY